MISETRAAVRAMVAHTSDLSLILKETNELMVQDCPDGRFVTAFAGLNMLQAGITGFCPAAVIFKAFGLKAGCAFK